jgi:hypothetical protein
VFHYPAHKVPEHLPQPGQVINRQPAALTVVPPLAGIPLDPDGMNEFRADLAQAALSAAVVDPTAPVDGVAFLLSYLMHYCDRTGVNFEQALRSATRYYAVETGEPIQLAA